AGDVAVPLAHQARGEPLLVAVDLRVLHQLLVEHVQDRLSGDVGHVVGARRRGAAEGTGAQPALLIAAEGHAEVLQREDLAGGLLRRTAPVTRRGSGRRFYGSETGGARSARRT